MSKHIELFYNTLNTQRKIEIDDFDEERVFLTIRKTVKGLENEFEDVLLTKKECRESGKILLIK